MKPQLLLLLGFACITSPVLGSGEVALSMDEVTLTSKNLGIQVQITETDKEKPAVQVSFKGKTTKVDDYFLFGADDIIKDSVRVIIQSAGPTQPATDAIAINGFMVSFEYGGSYAEHGDKAKGQVVRVHQVLRLHFRPDGSIWSERAKPEGDFANQWEILDRQKLGEDLDDTPLLLEGATCPFHSSVDDPNHD